MLTIDNRTLNHLADRLAPRIAERLAARPRPIDVAGDPEKLLTEAEAMIDRQLNWVQGHPILAYAPAGLAGGSFDADELVKWLSKSGFLVETFRDQIRARLLHLFDEEVADAKPGLPAAERRKRLAELDGEILELGKAEEVLIERLEAEGVDVVRRPEADPRIALGIEIPRTAA